MSLRPYKFLVQPVVQQVDDDGNVVGEKPVGGTDDGAPIVLFGCDALAEFAQEFPTKLAKVAKSGD